MAVNGSLRIVTTPFQTELAAMQEIADLVAPFDPSTRARILHWVAERFDTAVVPPVQASTAAVPALQLVPPAAPVVDEGLEVAAWDELFEPRALPSPDRDEFEPSEPLEPSEPPAPSVPPTSTNGSLHQFVAEFQDIVREWNVACGELETPSAVGADRPTGS